MVTGEHAVIYGHPAIVAAIDQRVTVQITARDDLKVRITSEIAPPQIIELDAVEMTGNYRFVLGAVQAYRAGLECGIDIDIRSEIDPTLGLGSSAAVTMATLAALARMTEQDTPDLHRRGLEIVLSVQGRGSGADLAASLLGGVLSYQRKHDVLEAQMGALPVLPQISLRYVGYKTPTGEVLRRVAEAREGREAQYDALYERMGAAAGNTIAAVSKEYWERVGAELSLYQRYMSELGVSDPGLDRWVQAGDATPGVLGIKISGSGLGDCVMALGAVPEGFTPVKLAREGIVFHGDA
jgi:mevalonate kinase